MNSSQRKLLFRMIKMFAFLILFFVSCDDNDIIDFREIAKGSITTNKTGVKWNDTYIIGRTEKAFPSVYFIEIRSYDNEGIHRFWLNILHLPDDKKGIHKIDKPYNLNFSSARYSTIDDDVSLDNFVLDTTANNFIDITTKTNCKVAGSLNLTFIRSNLNQKFVEKLDTIKFFNTVFSTKIVKSS
jgi:hypothetical protein